MRDKGGTVACCAGFVTITAARTAADFARHFPGTCSGYYRRSSNGDHEKRVNHFRINNVLPKRNSNSPSSGNFQVDRLCRGFSHTLLILLLGPGKGINRLRVGLRFESSTVASLILNLLVISNPRHMCRTIDSEIGNQLKNDSMSCTASCMEKLRKQIPIR